MHVFVINHRESGKHSTQGYVWHYRPVNCLLRQKGTISAAWEHNAGISGHPGGRHPATRGLPTGMARDLLQNFAPEPEGIAFLGKPLRGTYPRDLQMVYRHDVSAQSPALSVLMGPWYSPPDGWAHGLRFLYMTSWSFLSNLCMTIFPHERRRTISRRDRRAFFSRSKMKSVLKTQSERENKTMWNKKSFQRGKLTSMTSTKCSSRHSACPVLKCNQDSEVYKEFSGTFFT